MQEIPTSRNSHLHPAVVLQQSHQVTVLADLVLDVPHERPNARLIAAVGIPWHPALQEIFLLGIFLQSDKELSDFILLLKSSSTDRVNKFFPEHAPIPAFLWENVPKPAALSPLVHLLCRPHSEDGQDHSDIKFLRELEQQSPNGVHWVTGLHWLMVNCGCCSWEKGTRPRAARDGCC